jgi:hypothetical protein
MLCLETRNSNLKKGISSVRGNNFLAFHSLHHFGVNPDLQLACPRCEDCCGGDYSVCRRCCRAIPATEKTETPEQL